MFFKNLGILVLWIKVALELVNPLVLRIPELLPTNNSRTYQNCWNNSRILSEPESLIQAILNFAARSHR